GAGARYSTVAAQSIIARTYALRNRRRFNVDGYELCADTHCQVKMKLMCSGVSAKNWYYISWPRFRDYFRNIAFLIVIRYT
ncbi:SpoIID/LytB domain-containing protein, partial [Moorena sp. SIO4E2]|uniref:SpoIID/LytB domain-containing protein n=1 Tax=Moorena sp. SIO4E2 TaxID=2607826 RepID=UPI00338D4799